MQHHTNKAQECTLKRGYILASFGHKVAPKGTRLRLFQGGKVAPEGVTFTLSCGYKVAPKVPRLHPQNKAQSWNFGCFFAPSRKDVKLHQDVKATRGAKVRRKVKGARSHPQERCNLAPLSVGGKMHPQEEVQSSTT